MLEVMEKIVLWKKEDVWGNLFADYVATYESQKLRDSLS